MLSDKESTLFNDVQYLYELDLKNTPKTDKDRKFILSKIQKTLSNKELNINATDDNGYTLLHWAAQLGDLYIIELVQKKVMVVANGRVVEKVMVVEKEVLLLETLLKKLEIEINAQTNCDFTPLDLAKHYNRTNAVNLLLEQNAEEGRLPEVKKAEEFNLLATVYDKAMSFLGDYTDPFEYE